MAEAVPYYKLVTFLYEYLKQKIMESLFSTNISVNDKNAVYNVVFEDEKYVFLPEAKDNELPSFSFKREHDEWLDQELIAPDLKKQAVGALENYLLAQH